MVWYHGIIIILLIAECTAANAGTFGVNLADQTKQSPMRLRAVRR